AQRDRLLLDGAELAQVAITDAVVELVGRAPQLHREVLGGVPAGAQGRGRAAVDLQVLARIGRLDVGDTADHGETLVRGGAGGGAVLGERRGGDGQGGDEGEGKDSNGLHGGSLLFVLVVPVEWAGPN